MASGRTISNQVEQVRIAKPAQYKYLIFLTELWPRG